MKRHVKCVAFVLVTLIFCLNLVACSKSTQENSSAPVSTNGASAQENVVDQWPNKNITFYSASAGGTVDTNFRALAKVLEPYWGVSIIHVNNSTITSQDEMLQQAADGHAFSAMLLPDLFNYKNPSNSAQKGLDNFQFVANIISEPAAIAIHPNDKRFGDCKNLADFIAWCKANPTENVLVAVGPVANNHDIALRMLIQETGCNNLKIINTDGGISARKATFLGNHVDVYIGNAGDASQLAADGSAIVLAVFGEERSSVLPDVATSIEQGINVVYGGHRGIVCSPDVDPAIVEKMCASLEWAVQQPEYLEMMKIAGQETRLVCGEDYAEMTQKHDAAFDQLVPLFGW